MTFLAKGRRGRACGAATPHMLCGSPELQEQELPGSGWGLMSQRAKGGKSSISNHISGWSPLAKKDVWRSRNSHIWEEFGPAKSSKVGGRSLVKGKALLFLGWHWHGRRKQAKLPEITEAVILKHIIVHVPRGQEEEERTGNSHSHKGEGQCKTPKKAISILQPKLNPGSNKSLGKMPRKKKIKSTFSIIFIRKDNIRTG